LRAGTLDEAELIEPDAHFFASRRHPWIAIPPNVRTFLELPRPDDLPLMSEEAERRVAAAMGQG